MTGKRRNYVITELEKMNINFKYFEMVNFTKINELYNLLDLYIVSSRFEGGPQSILECAATKTPIISTDVGIAKEILSAESIYNMNNFLDVKTDVDYAYKNVEKFFLPQGIDNFNNYFKSLL